MRGEVETDEGVLVIRRIHVTYRLKAASEHRATVEKVHDFHRDKCPVYRTLKGSIDITTEYVLEDTEIDQS